MIFSRLKKEEGQAIVISSIFMAVLLGMCALVMDIGHDFRTKRRLQGTADAAALAGAQELPTDPGSAQSIAQTYGNKNGGDVKSISVRSLYNPNDTIYVETQRTEPSIFGRVLGINSAVIHAKAKARTDVPVSVMHVAPMVVHCNHPLIQKCNSSSRMPQFNVRTTLEYDPMGAPGAFGMLNLKESQGTPGTSEEAEWILHGFNKYLDVNKNYRSDPGAKFSSNEVQDALDARMDGDPVLLFPVFETLRGTGQNAEYYIIGWIGFHLESYTVHGNTGVLSGYFTSYIARGILASAGSGAPNYGVRSVQLIE